MGGRICGGFGSGISVEVLGLAYLWWCWAPCVGIRRPQPARGRTWAGGRPPSLSLLIELFTKGAN